jgi:hypothetical protein
MITTAYAITIKCNFCSATGPALNYDQNKYRVDADENHPNSVYFRQMNETLQRESSFVGFKCIKPSSNRNSNDAMHICLDCKESISELLIDKPEVKVEKKEASV